MRVPGLLRVACPLCIAVLFFYAPFFFRGEHAVAFNMERSASTGIPHGGVGPRASTRLPKDNSPVAIHYPNAFLAGLSLRHGRLPTWNPFNGGGSPALAGGQVYPFSPFLWPFYLKPSPWVYTAGLILGGLWGGIGAALWLRRYLGGWFLGLAVAIWVLNPWTARRYGFNDEWTYWWLGWLFWSWHRAVDAKGRFWWLPAVFMAGAVYGGHPESAFVMAAGSCLYALAAWKTGQGERATLKALFLRASGIAALALLLTAAHWIPLLANLTETASYKFGGNKAVTATAYETTNLLNPNSDAYLGAAAFALVLSGVLMRARGRKEIPLFLLAAGSWLICYRVGLLAPVQSLLSLGWIIPGIYALGLLWAAGAPLIALGVQSLCEGGEGKGIGRGPKVFGAVLLAYLLISWADFQAGKLPYLMIRKDLLTFQAVVLLLAALGLAGSRERTRKLGFAAASVLILLEPLAIQRFAYPGFNALDPLEGGPPPIARFRALADAEHGRLFADIASNRERSDLLPNFATLWGVRDIRMVAPLFLERSAQLQELHKTSRPGTLNTWLTFDDIAEKRLGLLGVAYRARLVDERSAEFEWITVPGALPRAYLAHRIYPAPDGDRARSLYMRWAAEYPGGPLAEGVLLEGWSGGERVGDEGAGDAVEWVEDGLREVRLRARSGQGGVLVLLDTFAEGWRAWVGETPATIHPANIAFRAVAVPAGDHLVTFRYEPRSIPVGLALAGFGWLVVLLMAGLARLHRGPG